MEIKTQKAEELTIITISIAKAYKKRKHKIAIEKGNRIQKLLQEKINERQGRVAFDTSKMHTKKRLKLHKK